MIYLYEPVGHGPHLWYCCFVIENSSIWLDFFGDGKQWNKLDQDAYQKEFPR